MMMAASESAQLYNFWQKRLEYVHYEYTEEYYMIVILMIMKYSSLLHGPDVEEKKNGK